MRDKQKSGCSCAPLKILAEGFVKRGYSDRFFHIKQCQSMNSFVSSPAPEFGLISFSAGLF